MENPGSFFNGRLGSDSVPPFVVKFLEANVNAVIGFNPEDRVTFWNPAAEQLYGWTASEAHGKTAAELFGLVSTPEEQKTQRQWRVNLEGGESVTVQFRPRHKDGSFLFVEYTASAIFDDQGDFSGYISMHHDISERLRADEEISRLYADLQFQVEENISLREILPIGIWIGNQDCSVITGNPAAYRIMGLTPGINVSLSNPDPEMPADLRIFVDGVEVAPKEAPMQTVARTGKPMYDFEHEFLFPDQTRKTFHASIAPIFDQHGQVRKVIAAYVDFTARKRSEEQLRLAREYAEQTADRLARLQKVTAALSEALTPAQVADVVVNQGAPALGAVHGTMMLITDDGQSLEIVQYGAPEPIIRPYRRFSLSLDVPASEAVRSGQPVWIESRQQYLERYPHLADQINSWGNQAAVAIPLMVEDRTLGVMTLSFEQILPLTPENLGFALTIASQGAQALERTRLYRQMQLALSELQMIYDQSPIGMMQLDTDLRYIRVNDTLVLYNGIPAAEHIGKSIREIVPDLAPKIEAGLRSVLETGESVFDVEVVAETKAEPGVPHTWLESWYPLRDEGGTVVGLNIVVQDITERKRAEEALRESEQQLQVLNESLEQKVQEQTAEVRKLASDLTKAEQRERRRISQILHEDLQQRLFAIQMRVEYLLDEHKKQNLPLQKDFEAIKKQMSEVVYITRHLSVDLSPSILRDEGLTQAITWLASQMEEQYGLRVELRAEDPFIIPNIDIQTLLFGAVRELLFNAVKQASLKRAVVSLQRLNGELRVEVRDEGRGMDIGARAWSEESNGEEDELQNKSFSLSTIRHRLSLFGGQLDVQSAPDGGTLVILTVPWPG